MGICAGNGCVYASLVVLYYSREHFQVCGEAGQTLWRYISIYYVLAVANTPPPSISSSCDGVQVGGVRSSYGILGSWTTVFHEELDPVGMFSVLVPDNLFVPG